MSCSAGAGQHDEQNYIEWLARDRAADRDDLAVWLEDVGARYAAGGTRVSVTVPDPHLPPAP